MVTIGGGRVLCPKQLGPGQLEPGAQLSWGCKESEPGEPLVFQLVQIYWVRFPSATFTFQIIGTGFVLFRIKTYQKSILEFFQLCRAR